MHEFCALRNLKLYYTAFNTREYGHTFAYIKWGTKNAFDWGTRDVPFWFATIIEAFLDNVIILYKFI